MNLSRQARAQYLQALEDVERGHRRRPWPSVLVLAGVWLACVGFVLGWLWLLWEAGAFIGSSLARLIQHWGLLS